MVRDGSRSIVRRLGLAIRDYRDLWSELLQHRYFRNLRQFDWHSIKLGQIIVASALINLLELASPLYINIVYTTILPKRATESLILLTFLVVACLLGVGWLKSVRLALVGREGAQVEHQKRMQAFLRFIHMPLSRYLGVNPSTHLSRLNSINLLRDESAVQSLAVAIDLFFSIFFIVVFVLLGGILVIPLLLGIVFYFFESLRFSRGFELISREKDKLDLERRHYHAQIIDSADLIKTNGLSNQFLVGGEPLQEKWSWQKMDSSNAIGHYQAFGSYVNQVTFACVATLGALMIIGDRLMVGALAACLLLVGKIFNPWQQAMALWNSFRRLAHTWDEYDSLMQEPVDLEGGQQELCLRDQERFSLEAQGSPPLFINVGQTTLLRDGCQGRVVRDVFVNLLRADDSESVRLNGSSLTDFTLSSLRGSFAYCSPSSSFFEGSLIQNITKFQPSCHERRAYFWCVLTGLDREIRALPAGYQTLLGTSRPSGLSSDAQGLLQIVAALSTKVDVVLIDLADSSYGKRFIDGLEIILNRCRGRRTLLVSGNGRVLDRLIEHQQVFSLPEPALVNGGNRS